MSKFIILLTFFLMLCFTADAQSFKIAGLYVASNGTKMKPSDGAEDYIDDIRETLNNCFQASTKYGVSVILSRPDAVSQMRTQINSYHHNFDSLTLFLGTYLCPWEKDSKDPFNQIIVGQDDKILTVDYLINMVSYLPMKQAIVFIVSPNLTQIDLNRLKGFPQMARNGKLLINVIGPPGKSYKQMLSDFEDILDDIERIPLEGDLNKDKYVSMNEWLSYLLNYSQKEKFNLQPFLLSPADDILLYPAED